MAKDYYAILGVARGADWVTVHHAFRTLARRYHPDTGNASSSAKFREVLEAYQALRDPVQRRQHDIDLGVATRKRRSSAERYSIRL
jgi:curved DNA-binding protein CbpA